MVPVFSRASALSPRAATKASCQSCHGLASTWETPKTRFDTLRVLPTTLMVMGSTEATRSVGKPAMLTRKLEASHERVLSAKPARTSAPVDATRRAASGCIVRRR